MRLNEQMWTHFRILELSGCNQNIIPINTNTPYIKSIRSPQQANLEFLAFSRGSVSRFHAKLKLYI